MSQIDQVTGMLDSGRLHRLTGISDRTLRDWLSKGIIPRTNSLEAAITAVCTHLQQQNTELRQRQLNHDDPHEAQKIRLTAARAEKAEMENRVRAEELVEAAGVAQVWAKFLAAAGAVLDNLPVRLAPQLANVDDPIEIEALLRKATDEVRLELGGSEFTRDLEPAHPDPDDPFASTEVDG